MFMSDGFALVGFKVGKVGNVLTILGVGIMVLSESCAFRVFAIIAVASVGTVGNVWNVTKLDTIFLVGKVCNVGNVPKVNNVTGGVFIGIGARRGGNDARTESPPPNTEWNSSKER
ncbi:unnamed protein product [Diamesa serratosioi]